MSGVDIQGKHIAPCKAFKFKSMSEAEKMHLWLANMSDKFHPLGKLWSVRIAPHLLFNAMANIEKKNSQRKREWKQAYDAYAGKNKGQQQGQPYNFGVTAGEDFAKQAKVDNLGQSFSSL